MNPYERAVLLMGRTRAFAWFGPRLFTPIDRVSHGRRLPDTTLGTTLPLVYLTTTGRHTGDPHTVALLGIRSDEGEIVVAGTNWGQPDDPAWVSNLRADPQATLEDDDGTVAVLARPAQGAEWDRLWAHCTSVWPAFEEYRRRSGREIALFVLDPEPQA